MKLINSDELIERVRNSGGFTDYEKLDIICLIRRMPLFEAEEHDGCEKDMSDIAVIDRQIKSVAGESKYVSENIENCGSVLAKLSDSLCRLIELKRDIIAGEIGV